jgi:urease accessory protein UreE
MLIVSHVFGHCDDAFWSGICETMEEQGALELLPLYRGANGVGQSRAVTDKGTVVGVMLKETAHLRPGSVLFYEEGRRVVLAQLCDARVLVIASLNDFSAEDALRLGHYLGERGWGFLVRSHPTHLEIFVRCEGHAEAAMDQVMREAPVRAISWTFRDRQGTDPL